MVSALRKRALLDSPAFAALDNRWCRFGRIVGCRVGDCDDCCMLRYRSDEGLGRAMMFLVSYIAIVG